MNLTWIAKLIADDSFAYGVAANYAVPARLYVCHTIHRLPALTPDGNYNEVLLWQSLLEFAAL